MVYTCRLLRSVFTDGMTDEIFRIKKKDGSLTWKFSRVFYWRNHREIQNGNFIRWCDWFIVRIADKITKGFKPESPYSDVAYLLSEWPTESSTDIFCRQKLVYDHSTDPLLPYFSFFFPIPTLPYCKQPTPPKKNLIYRRILSVFVSNSIF